MQTASDPGTDLCLAIEARRQQTIVALAEAAQRLCLAFSGALAVETGMSADEAVQYFARIAQMDIDAAQALTRRNLH